MTKARDIASMLTSTQTLSNKTFVAPALGTPASGTLTNATFPAGTPTKIAIVTLGSDVSRYSSGSLGDLTTLTYTPSRACTIRAVLRLSCKIHGYATNDCRGSLRCIITGTGSTTVTWDTESNSPAGQGYGQYFYNAPANFGIHTHTVFDVSLPDFVANNTNQITFDFDVATVATGSSNGWEWMGNSTTSETFLKIFECTT